MNNLISNLRIYWKFLSRNKLYSFVSILGFSISLMFVILLSIYVKQELSVDNFHKKKDRIYLMMHDNDAEFGNPVAEYVKNACPEVEEFVRIYQNSYQIKTLNTDIHKADCLFADSSFFNVFSFPLIEGDPSQVLVGKRKVVLTESYANKLFGTESPMGKYIDVEKNSYLVTGIMKDMPKNTQFPKIDFMASYVSINDVFGDWDVLGLSNNFGFTMYFLEKEGADLRAKEESLLASFKEEFWYYKGGFTDDLHFTKLQDAYFELEDTGYVGVRTNNKTTIMVYLGIVILILIVATLNYINMTVAQSSFRGKETAIKKLLGASRSAVIWQILLESLIMMLITFSLGVFMALLAQSYASSLLGAEISILEHITSTNIAACLVFILVVAFISGIAPALIISSFNPLEVVKGGLRKKIKSSYSQFFIVFQYTIAIALLAASFLVIQQFNLLLNYDIGFNRDHILVFSNRLDTTQTEGFKSKIMGMSGVKNFSYSQGTPVTGSNNYSFKQDGQQFSTFELVVDDAFYDIFGIKIKPTGVAPSYSTYNLNESAARALGMDTSKFTVYLGWQKEVMVSGIMKDFRTKSLHQGINLIRTRKLKGGDRPWNFSVKLDANTDVFSLTRQIENIYSEYTGGVKEEGQFVDQTLQKWYEKEKNTSQIISIFTYLTILITIMGIFAMSLYQVQQRQKEIALRKVNGATELELQKMLGSSALKLVLIAFVLAVPIAYYGINSWLEAFSVRISISPWVFLLSAVIIAVLTLVSVALVTWRIIRANPIDILVKE